MSKEQGLSRRQFMQLSSVVGVTAVLAANLETALNGASGVRRVRSSTGAAAGVARTVMANVINVSGNTYRYLLAARAGVDPKDMWVAGEVRVQFVAGSWTAGSGDGAVVAARTDELFKVSATLQTAGTASNAIAIGPLSGSMISTDSPSGETSATPPSKVPSAIRRSASMQTAVGL